MNRVSFFFKEALRSIGRNPIPSFAALMAVLITVLVLGVFIPAVQLANGAADDVRSRVQVSVFMDKKATKADVARVEQRLQRTEHVKSVKFVSKEQALAEQKKQNPEAYALLGKMNPLPDTFRITPDSAGDTNSLLASLMPKGTSGKGAPFDAAIGEVKASKSETNKIVKITGAVKLSIGALALLLIVASILLISNTIRLSLFSRRREVEVMKLVGATDSFIRWPFVIEGLILGAMGGAVAIAMLALAKVTILSQLEGIATLISRPDMIAFGPLIGLLVLASIGVSAAGSGLSLRRFLRV
ncbi:Cell division protein FtsX [Patulibacter medicamentivorans]|uniref:Cell division protein FtsX n=1 Tax=Patulibacter medicamentivorans TaxID=1097667 RepID=H0E047_9ACTN|nr:permease-like cell division protein FtsX [Patulibacter medicamentivorans]EHN12942.1 Cell division protein FtsX [Patulibacter medicamentivorans]